MRMWWVYLYRGLDIPCLLQSTLKDPSIPGKNKVNIIIEMQKKNKEESTTYYLT